MEHAAARGAAAGGGQGLQVTIFRKELLLLRLSLVLERTWYVVFSMLLGWMGTMTAHKVWVCLILGLHIL